MSAGLIKHLKKKTEEDSNTKILMSQWEFDEKLVGKSLENVGSYYPHFSSHNESHSQQILVNIERLLGSNIEKLTATDTWLILEAAYWHDIGMLFNAVEVQDVIENEHFKDYVEELANNNVQDLHEFAQVWHNEGWEAALVHYDNPYKGVEKYRQMVAEWYRRDHPANSERVVLKPFEKLNISSPRTELLPNRIYRYLAQICLSHGKSFNYVMQDLPFRQTGMGTEDCHPRFVACLLRLGDLFDIDDNRFCPVMARQVGNMPSFSETHKHKHQAIREFQLDNETVSVTAVCSTEMAYIECRNWFDWIREEIQNQMSQWKNIVPSRDFGLLPTINKLDVEMDGSKILLNDKPMRFSLDERSAIELLQGNNLYKDDMSIYRELIQNAIDATMIRVWLEHGQEYSTKKLPEHANPYDELTRNLLKDYPIILGNKKIESYEDSSIWEVRIEDNGIGISKNDLTYIQKIAGSKNNKEKQKIIRDMPRWMQPSGEFGIGLHSAFLLMKDLPAQHQKIVIYTKSRITHESLKIELNSPLSGKSGYCFIEKIDDRKKYGTTIYIRERTSEIGSMDYRLNKNIFLDIQDLSLYKGIKIRELDFLKKITKIKSTLNSPLVLIKYDKELRCFDTESESTVDNNNGYFWSSSSNAAIKFNFINEGEEETTFYRTPTLKYRGQNVSYLDRYKIPNFFPNIFKLKTLYFTIDIYGEKASKIISLSREDVLNENLFNNIVKQAYDDLIKYVKNNGGSILDIMFDQNYSMSSLFTRFSNENLTLDNDFWKDTTISNRGLTIRAILDSVGFSSTGYNRTELEPLSKLLDLDEILTFESYIMESLLENKDFQKILIEEGFFKYKILDENIVKNYSLYLYSKENISESLTSLERVNYNHMSSNIETIEDFYTLFKYKHMKMPSTYLKEIMKLEHKYVDNSFFSDIIKYNLSRILSEDRIEGIIIIPFLKNKDGSIIEIPNEQLVQLANASKEMKEEICQVYTDIKLFIINKTKEENSDWYKAYFKGKDFEPIDLSQLDKLHEPFI
ncbi:HD domain-containing protein [Psychrobacter maritimus]|uniref:HD domain-containing protein n=1 Tax=Psychrobacter maritimus TaxID=256325 RepID=UPI003FD26986